MASTPFMVVVTYGYQAVNEDELTLTMGHRIKVTEMVDEGWWSGEDVLSGARGVFPNNFVSPTNEPVPSAAPTYNPAPTYAPASIGVGYSQPPQTAPVYMQPPPAAAAPAPASGRPRHRVLYAYAAQMDDELNIKPNDIVTLLREESPGWWLGELNGQTGLVSTAMIDPNPLPGAAPVYAQEPAPVAAQPAAQAAAVSGPSKLDRMKMMGVSTPMGLGAPRGGVASAPRLPPDVLFRARVTHDYQAAADDELNLRKDDVILVKSKMEDAGWWDGQSEMTGMRGIFPNNFVEQISEQRRPSVEYEDAPIQANASSAGATQLQGGKRLINAVGVMPGGMGAMPMAALKPVSRPQKDAGATPGYGAPAATNANPTDALERRQFSRPNLTPAKPPVAEPAKDDELANKLKRMNARIDDGAAAASSQPAFGGGAPPPAAAAKPKTWGTGAAPAPISAKPPPAGPVAPPALGPGGRRESDGDPLSPSSPFDEPPVASALSHATKDRPKSMAARRPPNRKTILEGALQRERDDSSISYGGSDEPTYSPPKPAAAMPPPSFTPAATQPFGAPASFAAPTQTFGPPATFAQPQPAASAALPPPTFQKPPAQLPMQPPKPLTTPGPALPPPVQNKKPVFDAKPTGAAAAATPAPGDHASVAELRAWMVAEVDKLRDQLNEERGKRIALEARVASLERR